MANFSFVYDLFKNLSNTLKFCIYLLYSVEFIATCLYVMYNLSLNLIERNIPYDIQLFVLCRCLWNFKHFSGISASFSDFIL